MTLIEKEPQVLGPLDPQVARLVEEHVKRNGVRVVLNDGAAGFAQLDGGAIEVTTQSGKAYPADVVILAIGVRPDTTLAPRLSLLCQRRRRDIPGRPPWELEARSVPHRRLTVAALRPRDRCW